MSIGRIQLDESENSEGALTGYLSDVPRLILLILMLCAAVIGGYVNSNLDKPVKVINRSVEKSLARSFRASIEGTTSIGDSVVARHRDHVRYVPGKGLRSLSGSANDTGRPLSEKSQFDALSALRSVQTAPFITEREKEDMYGHGTRHYTGSFSLSTDGDSVVHAYEYWIDMRKLLAVRLLMTTVEQSPVVNALGDSLSKVTFINIRYHDWE
ncbi:MAG: hypothetical protein JXB48_21950 [Candidatus Latescibacteria bacterium]|nr:hypothetical protein [Candidatus Latescibacterota bacterium]